METSEPTFLRRRILAKLRNPLAVAQTLADLGLDSWDMETERLGIVRMVVPEGVTPLEVLARVRLHDNVEVADFDMLGSTCAYHAPILDTFTADGTGGSQYVDPVYDIGGKAHPFSTRNGWPLTWLHGRINTYAAWRHTKGSPAFKYAVLDEGWLDHVDMPDIPTSRRFYGTTNVWGYATDGAYYGTGNPEEPVSSFLALSGHGVMCASQIGAKHNGTGVSGVAPDCAAHTLKVTNEGSYPSDPGGLTLSNFLNCVVAAVDAGCRVLSVSLYWGSISSLFPNDSLDDMFPGWEALAQAAVDYTTNHDCLMFVASGNDGQTFATLTCKPQESIGSHLIIVGALAPWGGTIWYSNWDPKVDIVGPTHGGACWIQGAGAGDLLPQRWTDGAAPGPEDVPSRGYWSGTGTSTATPITAACCALAWSQNPALTADQMKAILFSTVSPFLAATDDVTKLPGVSLKHGNRRGVVNAAKAVLAVKATLAANVGIIYPFVQFFAQAYVQGDRYPSFLAQRVGSGDYALPGTQYYRGPYEGQVPPSSVWTDKAGTVARTKLNGPLWIETAGYSSAAVTGIEVWFNGVKLIDGPPQTVSGIATYDDTTARPVRVVAKTAGGSAEETYTDFDVTTLAVGISISAIDVAAGTVSGTRPSGATITASAEAGAVGSAALAPAISVHYPTVTTWVATVHRGSGPSRFLATGSDGSTVEATITYPSAISVHLTIGADSPDAGFVKVVGIRQPGATVRVASG